MQYERGSLFFFDNLTVVNSVPRSGLCVGCRNWIESRERKREQSVHQIDEILADI